MNPLFFALLLITSFVHAEEKKESHTRTSGKTMVRCPAEECADTKDLLHQCDIKNLKKSEKITLILPNGMACVCSCPDPDQLD